MKLKIAILVSSNGLGHIKRNIILAEYLSKKNYVILFTEKKKISKFKITNKIIIKNLNFHSQKKLSFYDKQIHRYIKIKGSYDLCLSDNYPENILNNKNTIFISNFFWHHLYKIDNKYYRNIEKKLKKSLFISNYLFCSKEIKNKFKVINTGFYGNFQKKKFIKKSKGILLSFGTADKVVDFDVKKFIRSIKIRNENPIFIDSKFYNKSLKKYNIHKANYSSKMFSNLGVAIIKPGLGVITDCLSYGIPILCLENKKYNQEFKYNIKILSRMHLCEKFNKLSSSLKFANKLINNIPLRKKIYFLSKKLKWNGEKTVLKSIEKYNKRIIKI
jgi:spore coat polysaccharide biosynthesis predicted glycosyltransferase SpsG